jgi:hypothetical protein
MCSDLKSYKAKQLDTSFFVKYIPASIQVRLFHMRDIWKPVNYATCYTQSQYSHLLTMVHTTHKVKIPIEEGNSLR